MLPLPPPGRLLPRVPDGLVKAGLKKLHRRQLGEVFADPDGLVIQMEEFHLLGIRGGAQNQSDRRLLSRSPFMLVEPAEIKLHLPHVPRLKGLKLQLDGDQAAEEAVIEEQVDEEVVVADTQRVLPSNEREALAELEEEPLDLLDQLDLVATPERDQEGQTLALSRERGRARPKTELSNDF